MKEPIRFVPEAVERIRHAGEKKISEFLDEVSQGSVRQLVGYLPRVPGFRPQREAGIKQQKIALAKRLSSKVRASDEDFFALYVIWRAWAREQLGDPDSIDDLLDHLEDVLKRPVRESDETAQSIQLTVLDFLEALKKLSLADKCSREKIMRLVEFGPFTVADAGQKIIASCKSESEIDRDKTLSSLPNRLRADEKDIEFIKDRMRALSAAIEGAVAKVAVIGQRSEENSQSLRSLNESITLIKQALSVFESASKGHVEALGSLEKRINVMSTEVRSLSERQDQLDQDIGPAIRSTNDVVANLSAIVEALGQKLADVSSTSSEAGRVGSTVQELSANIEGLHKRLETLESAKPNVSAIVAGADAATVSAVEIPVAPSTFIQRLDDAAKIVTALTSALQSIGLKKSAAALLAEEIATAAVTTQVVILKGALAHLVARKCATTLSGGNAWNVSIPIGLTDGRSLRGTLDMILSKSKSVMPSVVLEGLNRSALDSTKDAILDYTIDHAASAKPPLFCFVSLVAGIASLRVEPEHLELGPVLDLDYLDWRLSPERNVASAPGSLSATAIAALRTKLTGAVGEDSDEAFRLLRKFMPKRNARIERGVAAAYAVLSNLRHSHTETTPLQSLAYGWLVPFCVASRLSKEEVDSELDGGKCDATKPDTRVAAMIAGEVFGPESTEGER